MKRKLFKGVIKSVFPVFLKQEKRKWFQFLKPLKQSEPNNMLMVVTEYLPDAEENPEKFLYVDKYNQKWLFHERDLGLFIFKPWPSFSKIPEERYLNKELTLYFEMQIL
jgi:hypothetical protein